MIFSNFTLLTELYWPLNSAMECIMESSNHRDDSPQELMPDTALGAITRTERIILLSIAAICLLLYFVILF